MATSANYGSLYELFDSDLMRTIRQEAYGEDLGQHSWVTVDELRADLRRLELGTDSRLLDLGCGPGGPLVFAVRTSGCAGTGLELSDAAIASGLARARLAGVDARVRFVQADLNQSPEIGRDAFDAAMSLDVVLHLRDRTALFAQVAQALRPNGRWLYTDPGVITGPVASDELQRRSVHGYTQFVPAGLNENLIAAAGLDLIETEDRSASAARQARGRLRAIESHRDALAAAIGPAEVERQRAYLETVAELFERGALARWMYLARAR